MATTNEKLYVEIPHQRPAIAYWATDKQMIEFACENESGYLDQNFEDGEINVEQAIEAIGHDLSGLIVFESKEEALAHFATQCHQQQKAIKAINEL